LVAACLAAETEPSTTETGFTAPVTSLPQLMMQEPLYRKVADVYLGLQIANAFLQYGQLELQKGQGVHAVGGVAGYDAYGAPLVAPVVVPVAAVYDSDSDDDESEDFEEQRAADLEEEDDDSDDDDIALLELKSTASPSQLDLENYSSYAKMSALKSMQIQFYLAGSDVQKTYWINRIISLVLPPQLSMFKLYKTYLNTMSLSIAYQFHDSFTQEAYLDDFNDRWGSQASGKSLLSEALAEQTLYSHWSTLASLKYQMFLINMYEKMFYGQFLSQFQPQQQATASAAAASLLEVDSSTQFTAAPMMTSFLPYLQYYQLFLRYSTITMEIQLAQLGSFIASNKVAIANGQKGPVDSHQIATLEATQLPNLYVQWASLNQQKYYIDYYTLMIDFYYPQLAVAEAGDRAENVFQNLAETEASTKPETH